MADKVQNAATRLFRANGFHTQKSQDAFYWPGNSSKGKVKLEEEPGRADMIVLRNGSAVYVEVKHGADYKFPCYSEKRGYRWNQGAWAADQTFTFGMETFMLLVVGPSSKSPAMKINFFADYAEKLPKMAWLIPVYDWVMFCEQFEATHNVATVPYLASLSGRVSVKEAQDGLLERFGHNGMDIDTDLLVNGMNYALQWNDSKFAIPDAHPFLTHF